MKLFLFILLNLLTLTSYSQTTCFGTDQVPMLDVIELQEKSSQIPLHKFHNKLTPNPQSVVKSVKLEKYSMNQGAPEDINVNYFKNSENDSLYHLQTRALLDFAVELKSNPLEYINKLEVERKEIE